MYLYTKLKIKLIFIYNTYFFTNYWLIGFNKKKILSFIK